MDDRSAIPAPVDTAPKRWHRICVATDFSRGSMRAVRRVARLRLGVGALVHLVHVLPGGMPQDRKDRAYREAKKALEQLCQEMGEAAKHAGNVATRIEPVIAFGRPSTEIMTAARAIDAELVVFGRRGRSTLKGLLLGSTAERVMRGCTIPVLMVARDPQKPYRRPLVASDLSAASHVSLDLLLRLCEPLSRVNLVHVSELPYKGFIFPPLSREELADERRQARAVARPRLKALLEPYAESGVSIRPIIRTGDPRSVIYEQVLLKRADLVVLASHGRKGISHAFLGSVAEWVAREVSCDVLLARPEAEHFEKEVV